MSKREKLRRKLRTNPGSGTMLEVETLLTRFGFQLARVQGSHHIFEYDDGVRSRQIVVPAHGQKVKKVYIQRAVEIIDELFPEADVSGDDDNE